MKLAEPVRARSDVGGSWEVLDVELVGDAGVLLDCLRSAKDGEREAMVCDRSLANEEVGVARCVGPGMLNLCSRV